jgi:hypothetical protein
MSRIPNLPHGNNDQNLLCYWASKIGNQKAINLKNFFGASPFAEQTITKRWGLLHHYFTVLLWHIVASHRIFFVVHSASLVVRNLLSFLPTNASSLLGIFLLIENTNNSFEKNFIDSNVSKSVLVQCYCEKNLSL